MKFKTVTKQDIPILLQLIKELAHYEHLLHEVCADESSLNKWIIDEKKAEALLLEVNETIIGFILYFNNFSTFLGKPGIYLEDLYIKPEYRNKGYGKLVFKHLAQICIQNGYGRLEWSVLDWNEPSIQFYQKQGAIPMSDWTVYRLSEEELKLKVEEELSKNREKDRILIQQNKLAAMGEMLGNIAHQWRQPLNNVSLILQFLRDNYKNKEVSEEKIDKFINKANKHIEYMSETIDDFRNFYKPSKTQNKFFVFESIDTLLDMVKNQYESENIKINFEYENIEITNYENELKQALLNILNNAKDALLSKKDIEDFDAFINISLYKNEEKMILEISNNGGNINEEILYKIFEPYFTTKFETQGTGIGLYMTKSIIETNMKGKIEVQNIINGVKFTITLNI